MILSPLYVVEDGKMVGYTAGFYKMFRDSIFDCREFCKNCGEPISMFTKRNVYCNRTCYKEYQRLQQVRYREINKKLKRKPELSTFD
jgi:hypothetical protein